ncbi:MAG: hypothetical protein BGO70_17060 [Bacteroidetes bacterium 43-93]|mgnify:CR=1 FL=1|nr:glycosyltransferase family 39 protein [Bacteroidota bacterium]OJX01461.1 MAG: hypothetical protein BGO70_17060 [Bacteroidetes bacterium 43-93]
MKKLENYYLLITLVLVTVFVLPNIGHFNVQEWDEARNGVNAYEMAQNHDYFNLYYAGEPDTWNAKPPLLTWCIVASYNLFGYNEWGLRFPSFVFTLAFFTYFYLLVKNLKDRRTAMYCCLLLLSCKAILGMHVGLTGDFDILLTWFLTASAYYFVRYIDGGNRAAILLTGAFTGLAFYAKGPAAFLFIPGLMLYAIYSGKWKQILKDKLTWLAVALSILIAASWLLLQSLYGLRTDPGQSRYGSNSSIEVLLWHDVVRRFTDADFDHGKYIRDYFFCAHAFDVRMNIWNYIFYLIAFTGCILLYKHRKDLRNYTQHHPAIFFAISLSVLPILFLTLSMNQHDWYLAPVWPQLTIILVSGMQYFAARRRQAGYLFLGLWLALTVRHVINIVTEPEELHLAIKENADTLHSCDTIICLGAPYQNILLYAEWQQKPMLKIDNISDARYHSGQLLLLANKIYNEEHPVYIKKVFRVGEDYMFARIN